MDIQTTPVVLDCPSNSNNPPGRVLKMTAKCYHTTESASNEEGFSLLFAHCIGAHKEQWEAVIERIFRVQQSKPRHQRVREAWAFDWQSHGDAAALNHELLVNTRQTGVCAFLIDNNLLPSYTFPAAYEWADAIAAFAGSPQMKGKRMVAIGHSAGTGAIMMSMHDFPVPAIPYVSAILIEPPLATWELFDGHAQEITSAIVAATKIRRELWRSRLDAYEWLKRRAPWNRWDARVLRVFVEHGLRDTLDGEVVLKCDRHQEAIAYPDIQPHIDAVEEIGRVCRSVPVHLVWANQSAYVPKTVQDSVSDISKGRKVASITRLDGGHMVVQEDPDGIALVICNILDSVDADLAVRTRGRL